jgi:molecular chaperone HscB
MQQMEWREALEEARSSKDLAALEALEKTLRVESRDLQAHLGALLDEQHDFTRAGDTLRKVRFMDKLLEEVGVTYEEIE